MDNTKQSAVQKRVEFLNTIISDLENNTAPWRDGMKPPQLAMNAITGKIYTGVNLINLTFYNNRNAIDNRWLTFLQAKENGYHVQKGAKSETVFFYRNYDVLTKKDFDIRTIKHLSEQKKTEYEKENVKHIITQSCVFNATQIDGIPPIERKSSISLDDFQKQLLQNSEAPISFISEQRNFYSPIHDTIAISNINNWNSSESLTSTILHEIIHSTGHNSRLNRDIINKFGTSEYAREELIAELGTVLAMSENGFTTDPSIFNNNQAYVKSWLTVLKDKPSIINEIIRDAEKAFMYVQENIIEREMRLEKNNIIIDTKTNSPLHVDINSISINNTKTTNYSDMSESHIQWNTSQLIKALQNEDAPFLQSSKEKDYIIMEPIGVRSAITGKMFKGLCQLVAQNSLQKLDSKAKDVITYDQAKELGADIIKASRGFTLEFYDTDKKKLIPHYFYSLDSVVSKEKLPKTTPRKITPIKILCKDPELDKYLGKYLAATAIGAKFVTTDETIIHIKSYAQKELAISKKENIMKIYEIAKKANSICKEVLTEIGKEMKAKKNIMTKLTTTSIETFNPVTGEKFTGVNAQKALLLMEQRKSNDPRFLEMKDIEEYKLTLKKSISDNLIVSSNGEKRIFYNAKDIEGLEPYKQEPVKTQVKKLSTIEIEV